MIYEVLKPFVKLSLHTFFRKIEVIGKENLEPDAPIIFVSNHPNAFLDPLVFLTTNPYKEHFIAGAEWFGKGFKNWLFRKEFNMIPVVRPWLKPGKKVTNEEMFIHCFECLEQNGRIVIYPEGTSVTVTKIRELKTGAARIKIGADRHMKDKETLVIPVGINYSNPKRFQSEVVINVGPPIDFSDIPETGDKEMAAIMTERIHEKMSGLVLHYEDTDHSPLAGRIFRMYGNLLRTSMGIQEHESERKFRIRQDIMKAVNHFHSEDQEGFRTMKSNIDQYFKLLEEKGVEASRLTDNPVFPWGWFGQVVVLAPIFALGFLFNAVPFLLARWLFSQKINPRISEEYEPGKLNPSFIGSLTFLLGMGIFSLWYLLLCFVVGVYFGTLWAIPFVVVTGYVTGLISLAFARLNYRLSQQLRIRRFRRKDTAGFQKILALRHRILSGLEEYHGKYQEAVV